ncbi:MAG: FeoB-associated Cys-rich membrane protein [Clostridia bacterium]|nr:FeoB-associated Cys-rich membrane protein [Clostridia bacterium]
MNFWDFLILAGVAAMLGFAWRVLHRRSGKSCSCGCDHCARTCEHRKTNE